MTPFANPHLAGQFLESFAVALEDGLGVPAAFRSAATATACEVAVVEAQLSLRALDGKLTCSALLDGLVAAETLAIVRAGEMQADVIGHLRLAADAERARSRVL
jgi:hypothetical protein